MRLMLAATLFAVLPLLPAEAAKLQMPSPCDHVIPTGAPLPRQAVNDTVGGGAVMYDTPSPGRRSAKVGLIGADEAFTILRECNSMLQVRNARGEEGWTKVVVSRAERELQADARKRPPQSDRDCEIYNLDTLVAERCKAGLAATRKRDELAQSAVFLGDDGLREMLAGKTLVLLPLAGRPLSEQAKIRMYHAPDGELFVYRDAPLVRWRGRWIVKNGHVCAPFSGTPCGRVREEGGRRLWTVEDFDDQGIELTDGDSSHVVAEVTKRYPDPVAPPAPDGAEAVAGPAMGQ